MPTPQTATDERPLFYVEVRGEELDGHQFQIGGDGLLIGRSPTCDVIFDSREVSRRHCYFYPDGKSCVVKDLGSKNGIIVNGKLTRDKRLADGDTVEVGPSRLVMHIKGGSPAGGKRTEAAVPDLVDRQPADFATPRHPLAIAGIVFALLAYLHWSFGLGAALLALVSLWEVRRQADRLGRSLAVGAVAIALVGSGMNLWFVEAAPGLREKDELAARMECRDNLLDIAAALKAYRAAHAGAPPERLDELVAQGLLKPERLLCPAGGQNGAADLRYLFAAGPDAASESAFTVIVCDPGPDCHQQQGGWLLMADGHTEWMPRERFERILSELKAGRQATLRGGPARRRP